MPGLDHSLRMLPVARQRILACITKFCRAHGYGALLSVGSLPSGGDAFSDIDLVAVPAQPQAVSLDLTQLTPGRLLCGYHEPGHGPADGGYTAVCAAAVDALVWAEIFIWPRVTAAIPDGCAVIYDHFNLARSQLGFIPLNTRHAAPVQQAVAPPHLRQLADIATAAKYLSRNNLRRMNETIPRAAVTTMHTAAEVLHRMVTELAANVPGETAARTHRLIDMAEHQRLGPAGTVVAAQPQTRDDAHHGGR